jgi:hypothetical protein
VKQYPRTSFRNPLCVLDNCSGGKFKNKLCRDHYLVTLTYKTNPDPKYCSVTGCDKKHHGKSFCVGHYYEINSTWVACTVVGCPRLSRHLGLCPPHYANELERNPKEHKKKTRKQSCNITGCLTAHFGNGLCKKHYNRNLRHGDTEFTKISMEHELKCLIPGCAEDYASKGFCNRHYSRSLIHGNPSHLHASLVESARKCRFDFCSVFTRGVSGYCKTHIYLAESVRESAKKYKSTDRGKAKQRERSSRNRVKRLSATIPSSDFIAIAAIYETRKDNEAVDHIIPIIHKLVCGLHVTWNMQILSRSENSSKSNQWDGTYENNSWREKFKKRLYNNG